MTSFGDTKVKKTSKSIQVYRIRESPFSKGLQGYTRVSLAIKKIPDDEAYRLILCRSYEIKLQKTGRFGAKCTNLSHLPENIHKRFCAHPAEKQDALFCCSVNFHHWRYGFESLSPVLTDKTAAISEGKFRRGGHTLPAVYYRFPKDFEMKEGISHEHHYRHRPRL